jgi:anaerobic selenocysteine-containing dehydrogenase
MKAEVKEGKLVDIQGDEGNPDSQGFLCVRGRAAEEIIGNNQRLLYPLARDSRESQDWRRVSWDDVLDRIANAMANAGGNRVGITLIPLNVHQLTLFNFCLHTAEGRVAIHGAHGAKCYAAAHRHKIFFSPILTSANISRGMCSGNIGR